ncbi:MAG: SPOR domain-containing protein [Magnetococcales bacterium]|nr:SPOR domain-containing protein [Magnetococcales bacterium]
MNEDLLELKRNLIKYHNNKANLTVDDEVVDEPTIFPVTDIDIETQFVEPEVEQESVEFVTEPPVSATTEEEPTILSVEEIPATLGVEEPTDEVIEEIPATLGVEEPTVEPESTVIEEVKLAEVVAEEVIPLSSDAEKIFADSRVAGIPTASKSNPTSGELISDGLALVWQGSKTFFWRLAKTRRPLGELVVIIPVALLIGYQFKTFTIESGEKTVSITPAHIEKAHKATLPQLVVKPESVKPESDIFIETVSSGVADFSSSFLKKVAGWRDGMVAKVNSLQEESDRKEAVNNSRVLNSNKMLVVVTPPKKQMTVYQSAPVVVNPVFKAETKTFEPRPIRVEPVAVEVPKAAAAIKDVLVEEPELAVVEQPVEKVVAAPLPLEGADQVPATKPLNRHFSAKQANPVMVAPATKPHMKPVFAKQANPYMVAPSPKPQAKIHLAGQANSAMVAPAPKQKYRSSSYRGIKVLSKAAPIPLHKKTVGTKGFVLFLGSYRQSKFDYMQKVIDNLQNEPLELIKQTVKINDVSYTRLYAGPFADRKAAITAKEDLFASQKINSSITFLQPGVSQYSQIEQLRKKVGAVKRPPTQQSAGVIAGEKYVVRVGSYQNVGIDSSGNLLRKIIALGGVGFQKDIEVNGKTFWRVYSGPYVNIEQAIKARQVLEENLSLPNMVVMSKNSGRWVKVAKNRS